MSRPRFRTLAHGADLRVAIWGDNERELICNAVLAAMTLALGTKPQAAGRRRFAIRPWPQDLPSQLVRAVNEALFALYVRHEIATDFEANAAGATLEVGPLPAGTMPEIEVKAATDHDLRPRRRGGRFGAMLTLDV